MWQYMFSNAVLSIVPLSTHEVNNTSLPDILLTFCKIIKLCIINTIGHYSQRGVKSNGGINTYFHVCVYGYGSRYMHTLVLVFLTE